MQKTLGRYKERVAESTGVSPSPQSIPLCRQGFPGLHPRFASFPPTLIDLTYDHLEDRSAELKASLHRSAGASVNAV